MPFLIDWGESPHPATDAPGGVTLDALRAEHPQPDAVRSMLAALDVELEVTEGPAARLFARITGPAGSVDL